MRSPDIFAELTHTLPLSMKIILFNASVTARQPSAKAGNNKTFVPQHSTQNKIIQHTRIHEASSSSAMNAWRMVRATFIEIPARCKSSTVSNLTRSRASMIFSARFGPIPYRRRTCDSCSSGCNQRAGKVNAPLSVFLRSRDPSVAH